MTHRTVVLNVVGLTEEVLADTPQIRAFRDRNAGARIIPDFPAVTCTAQSSYVTGLPPSSHGIVANGWYNREQAEVQFWKQSNHLVHGPKIWDHLRETVPGFTCAKLFWWYNMYATVDYSITPRPMYPADGRKFFDVYSWPYSIRTRIKKELGDFPFPGFWGPAAGLKTPQGSRTAATDWIAESAMWIEKEYSPTLSLVYLPHLDYNLQRLGPRHPGVKQDYAEIDHIVGGLIEFFESRSLRVILLSEYGLTEVRRAIHLNRYFRQKGWVVVKEELGLEMLDAGASKVFAVVDHQVAHVYVNDPSLLRSVRTLLETIEGVAGVFGRPEQAGLKIDHPRAGDFVVVAREDAWFSYYYWMDDALAPDFARCIDIHRKPGYDPVELFLDPKYFPARRKTFSDPANPEFSSVRKDSVPGGFGVSTVKLRILTRLLKKKLGFRMLMDVIPLDASLVRGSHGARPSTVENYPVFISNCAELVPRAEMQPTDVYHAIKRHVI